MAQTNKKVQFSYFAQKATFLTALASDASLANHIVFIEDTKDIFSHGTYFGFNALTLAYDSSTTKLQLKHGSTVVADLDATPFIKDGMLNAVTLHTTAEQDVSTQTPYLKFVFNTRTGENAAAHETIRVSVKDLVDIYNGANLILSNSYEKASAYTEPTVGDSMDTAIGKLAKGIDVVSGTLTWNEY